MNVCSRDFEQLFLLSMLRRGWPISKLQKKDRPELGKGYSGWHHLPWIKVFLYLLVRCMRMKCLASSLLLDVLRLFRLGLIINHRLRLGSMIIGGSTLVEREN